MLKDLSLYQDCRRSDLCPCGSGKNFKACCMKEYREAKKQIKEVTVLPFSPMGRLESKQKKMITDLYMELMRHVYKQRTDNETIDSIEDMAVFMQEEREHFFADSEKYLDTFKRKRQFDEDEQMFIDGVERAHYGDYIHISHNDQTAILLDLANQKMLSIKGLNDTFDQIFAKDHGLFGVRTAVIPFGGRLISDGVYGPFEMDEKLEPEIHEWLMSSAATVYHQEQPTIRTGPFIISAAFMAHPEDFEAMEESLLERIPNDFYNDLQDLIRGSGLHFERIVPLEGFLRSTDLSEESNRLFEEERSFENVVMHYSDWLLGESSSVPMYIWNKVYHQPVLAKSISGPSLIPKIAKVKKEIGNSRGWIMGYFSIVCYVSLHEKELDNWMDWMDNLTHVSSERQKVAEMLDSMTEKLSERCDFDCEAVFLDVGADYAVLDDGMTHFRDAISEAPFVSMKPEEIKRYSVDRSLSESFEQTMEKVLKSMMEVERKSAAKRNKPASKAKKKSPFKQPSLFDEDEEGTDQS